MNLAAIILEREDETMTTMYTVTVLPNPRIVDATDERIARVFDTLRAARRFAAWLMTRDHVREVRIYQGGVGGMRVTL